MPAYVMFADSPTHLPQFRTATLAACVAPPAATRLLTRKKRNS
ncbi:hypothetical protein ACIHFD_04170 [Nonomuraea sp. NPDC051941]